MYCMGIQAYARCVCRQGGDKTHSEKDENERGLGRGAHAPAAATDTCCQGTKQQQERRQTVHSCHSLGVSSLGGTSSMPCTKLPHATTSTMRAAHVSHNANTHTEKDSQRHRGQRKAHALSGADPTNPHKPNLQKSLLLSTTCSCAQPCKPSPACLARPAGLPQAPQWSDARHLHLLLPPLVIAHTPIWGCGLFAALHP